MKTAHELGDVINHKQRYYKCVAIGEVAVFAPSSRTGRYVKYKDLVVQPVNYVDKTYHFNFVLIPKNDKKVRF